MKELNGYDLSRNWFDFCFENPELIKPAHTAIYMFAIEHCNRLGWKQKFGFPSQMCMDAIGIKKYQTYINSFRDIVDWGFFDLIQKSKNQYSSNIISLQSALPKKGKALDKAIKKHRAKQGKSTGQSKDSINKHINLEPLNNETIKTEKINFADLENSQWFESILRYLNLKITYEQLSEYWVQFQEGMIADNDLYRDKDDYRAHFRNWVKIQIEKNEKNRTNNRRGFDCDTSKRTIESIIRRAEQKQ